MRRLKLRLRSELSRCDSIGAIIVGGSLLLIESALTLFIGSPSLDGLILPPFCAFGLLRVLSRAVSALLLGMALGAVVCVGERALAPLKLRGCISAVILIVGELTRLKLIAAGAYLSGILALTLMLAAGVYLLILLGRVYLLSGLGVGVYLLGLCTEIYFCVGIIILN